MKVGEKITFMRKEMALTREELAKKCSVSFQSVALWESGGGTPRAKHLEAIERLYDIYRVQHQDTLLSVNDKAFPEKLRKLRLERKLSQVQFAKAIGTSNNAIFQWEKGDTLPTAEKLKSLRKFQQLDYKGDDTDKFLENFFEKLTSLKEHLGLSVVELAKAIGISQPTFYNLQTTNKRPHPDTIRKIASFCTERGIDFNNLKAGRKKHLTVSSQDITKFRDEFHLTQAQFAGIIKTSHTLIYKWESGNTKPTPRYQRRLSKVMASRGKIWNSLHKKLYFLMDKNVLDELGDSASLVGDWLKGTTFPTQGQLATIDRLCTKYSFMTQDKGKQP